MELVQSIVVTVVGLAVLIGLARTALGARTYIADFQGGDKEAQTGLPRIVYSELEMLREEGGGASLRFMSAPDGPIKIPEPLTKLTGVGYAVQLVQLLPRRVHTVSAHLHTDTVRGAALSVRLDRSETLEHGTTLYVNEFLAPPETNPATAKADPPAAKAKTTPPAEASSTGTDEEPGPAQTVMSASTDRSMSHKLHLLSVAASAWVAFHLPTQDEPRLASDMLTASWISYAHFRIGAIFQQARDDPAARFSYAQALFHDPLNRGALHNLALLDINAGCNGVAIDRLAILCQLLPYEPHPTDRLWYRARLNLAIACMNERKGTTFRRECSSQYEECVQDELARSAVDEVESRSDEVLKYVFGCDDARQAPVPDAGTWRSTRRMLSPELVIFLRNARDLARVLNLELLADGRA